MIEAALTGRLGQPQFRTSAGGKRWASFSLAVGTGDEREWVSIAVFETRAWRTSSPRRSCSSCVALGNRIVKSLVKTSSDV
jgi:hypothetical protein